jgi:hypothetical protein
VKAELSQASPLATSFSRNFIVLAVLLSDGSCQSGQRLLFVIEPPAGCGGIDQISIARNQFAIVSRSLLNAEHHSPSGAHVRRPFRTPPPSLPGQQVSVVGLHPLWEVPWCRISQRSDLDGWLLSTDPHSHMICRSRFRPWLAALRQNCRAGTSPCACPSFVLCSRP